MNSEVDAVSGFTKANPQFGEGGACQVFVPNVNELIEKSQRHISFQKCCQ
ncbi:hypothetical protein [Listeria welshimeri]|nr:hypothetical protein [Listeria welshimeri]